MKIDVFKKVINAENEAILQSTYSTSKSMTNQMVNAYNQIATYLDSSELKNLNTVSIDTVSNVMRNVWKVKEFYDKQKN